uniref:GntR family transcriptional regulator n=1 Tax=OCS116 cluster bacterium TaxID=2030921 RepID=A0A2A4Z075_9PROT
MNVKANLTQAQQAYVRLRSDILSCRIKPGAKIRINDIAKDFGVSIGAVREALSSLVAENMATTSAQKGFRVPEVSPKDLLDLTNARLIIEEQCLREAIENHSLDWESELVASFHRLKQIPETDPADDGVLNDQWSVAHFKFHDALVSACPNTWLLKLRLNLYEQTERYRYISIPLRADERDVALEHQNIFDATIARKADLAVVFMREHLLLTSKIIIDSPMLEKLQNGE